MTFGPFLEAARRRSGMTQDDLGIAVGCSRSYLANLESEAGVPSPSLLCRLADALVVDLGTLTRLAGALQGRRSAAVSAVSA